MAETVRLLLLVLLTYGIQCSQGRPFTYNVKQLNDKNNLLEVISDYERGVESQQSILNNDIRSMESKQRLQNPNKHVENSWPQQRIQNGNKKGMESKERILDDIVQSKESSPRHLSEKVLTVESQQRSSSKSELDIDWPQPSENEQSMESPQRLLSRHKREFTWDDVEEFYDDKNNLAMYLVLPIIVIVYGGCAVIYCIARCRRYIKRKRKPSKAEDQEFLDNEPFEVDENGQPLRHPSIPVISSNQNGGLRDGGQTSSDVSLSLDPDNGVETPLPWQVPGERQLYPEIGAAAAAKSYSNKAYESEILPPPKYEEPYMKRPESKPPPYEEKNNRVRRGSVEEIITLEQIPMPTNDRKRRHPGSRPASSATVQDNRVYDEERERARQLVRGTRERREIPALERHNQERTPDIISHARTQPLQPSYRPPREDAPMDASIMAKQAAQLLRLDHMGKTQGKKQKRLVFVAE